MIVCYIKHFIIDKMLYLDVTGLLSTWPRSRFAHLRVPRNRRSSLQEMGLMHPDIGDLPEADRNTHRLEQRKPFLCENGDSGQRSPPPAGDWHASGGRARTYRCHRHVAGTSLPQTLK
jgi:hypothetical protein